MAFSKLALLALAVGARAADDDQVVVGQTFMAGAIDPTSDDGHDHGDKCVGSKDSCKALPGGKVESSAGGHAYEDSDGALGRKALAAAAAAVLAGLAF